MEKKMYELKFWMGNGYEKVLQHGVSPEDAAFNAGIEKRVGYSCFRSGCHLESVKEVDYRQVSESNEAD